MDGTGRDLLSLLILVLCLDLSLQYGPAHGRHNAMEKRYREENLKRAKRAWVIDTFELEEELPGPYPKLIGRVQVEEDEQMKYELTGIGVDEDPKGVFHINEEDGSIYVHRKIDYETTPMFQWKFNAINKTSLKVGTKLGIHLKILDINDNAPKFIHKSYEVYVNESFVQGNTAYTVLATDFDEEHSLNSRVDYRIVSQTPTDSEVEFTVSKETGFISFKGCLDYERNKNYKLTIEAKDNGVEFQLSSTCEVVLNVIDRNNHLPVWNASPLKSSVPEREENVTIMRFGITDGDTSHTSAWRAVYSIISGNDDGNFVILTDPKTNEGILRVIKPLDYETTAQSTLSVLVENEEPFFSCKVLQKTKTGLWQLETAKARGGTTALQTRSLVVDIDDVNDPPVFIPDKITISTFEHSMEANTVLGKVEAKDMDIVKPNNIKFRIANDSADWLSINEDTGVITAKCQMDRESDYVTNSKYIVEVLAADDGKPSLTGTAMLFINLKDINDNAPRLESPFMSTCFSEEEAVISAMVKDKDLDPYSGPFHFDVLDKDHETKKLQVMNKLGDSLQIMKLKDAAPGNHTLHLEIYDRQGVTSLQNLTVYVCDCLNGNACVMKMTGPPALGGGAIILLLLAMLLFLGLSLLLCKIHNKKEMIQMETEPLNSIIVYNEEGGNKDCLESSILNGHMVGSAFNSQETQDGVDAAFDRRSSRRLSAAGEALQGKSRVHQSHSVQAAEEALQGKSRVHRSHSVQGAPTHSAFDRATSRRHSSYHRERRMNTLYRAALHQNSINVGQQRSSRYATNSLSTVSRKHSRIVETVLQQRLETHAAIGEIYKPRTFAEEGNFSKSSSLEAITIAGSTVHMASLENLGSKFNILEDICLDFISSRSMEEPSMTAENMDGINNALS